MVSPHDLFLDARTGTAVLVALRTWPPPFLSRDKWRIPSPAAEIAGGVLEEPPAWMEEALRLHIPEAAQLAAMAAAALRDDFLAMDGATHFMVSAGSWAGRWSDSKPVWCRRPMLHERLRNTFVRRRLRPFPAPADIHELAQLDLALFLKHEIIKLDPFVPPN